MSLDFANNSLRTYVAGHCYLSLDQLIAALFGNGEQGLIYDPSDLSTLFQDAAGTTPVTGIEQPVGLMLDKSGRGNHAYQITATSRPILRQDANGKYYLYTDGIDDFMVTNAIDFTGTDKMTVVTGLRKIGTAVSVPIELSTTTNTNAGAFGVYTQDGTNSYSFASSGTGPAVTGRSPAAYVPPITNVITGIANISAPLNQLRVNGSVTTTVTTSQGTGNFGNYPLYLFRRGGTSLPANVYFYGLIVRGAETQEALLNPGQRYIAGKTGVSL